MLAQVAAKNGWHCERERTIIGKQGEKYRPDLICTKQGHPTRVLDVTIVFERHPQTLELAFRAKQQKYKILRELLEHKLGTQQIDIQGFPVGARGKWFPHNFLVLEKLGERNVRRTAIKISKMTLLMSLDILGAFTRETPGT